MHRPERTVHRGEIYYADLNPVVGSEQGGIRPVLILQNEVGNWFSPTVIVAAVTAKGGKARLPTHVPVGTGCGLRQPSLVLAEQVRTIDKSRLLGRVGTLSPGRTKTGGPGAAHQLRPFTTARGGTGMDARGIIDYYGMLRLLKALEGHGFTEKELKRVAARLEAELEADLRLSAPKQAA